MDREAIRERFGIIGDSAAMRNVIDRVRQVARTPITVLVQGESGVGKELIAHAIHELSPRRHGPLVIVNCGAIPEGLIESELFGAEKGSYTGATERRTGHFEEADGGSIFLDEIGEMPLAAQVRLLRVLENGTFSRVGSSQQQKVEVRIIAATNKDLAREVEAGRFREDLYYRLSTVIIRIPPLRERKEDILPIFEHFMHRLAQEYNTGQKKLDEAARELLGRYRWPGNVRELRNVAEQATVLTQGDALGADALRSYLRGISSSGTPGSLVRVSQQGSGDFGEMSEARERELIYRALVELRLEIRELKEQVSGLASNVSVAVPRQAPDGSDTGSFVIVREGDRDDYASLIEDVPYEIEPENGAGPGTPADEEADAADALPTLEDAERRLITEALKRFDGNRRQTARALGISERTLYRKLKEIDEEV